MNATVFFILLLGFVVAVLWACLNLKTRQHRIRMLACKFMERKPYQPVLASALQDYITQQGVRFTSPEFYEEMASLEEDGVIVSAWVEHKNDGFPCREKSYVHKEWL